MSEYIIDQLEEFFFEDCIDNEPKLPHWTIILSNLTQDLRSAFEYYSEIDNLFQNTELNCLFMKTEYKKPAKVPRLIRTVSKDIYEIIQFYKEKHSTVDAEPDTDLDELNYFYNLSEPKIYNCILNSVYKYVVV